MEFCREIYQWRILPLWDMKVLEKRWCFLESGESVHEEDAIFFIFSEIWVTKAVGAEEKETFMCM